MKPEQLPGCIVRCLAAYEIADGVYHLNDHRLAIVDKAADIAWVFTIPEPQNKPASQTNFPQEEKHHEISN